MGTVTKIEWCHHTFNPWWGCTRVAEGCRNCYAEAMDVRWFKGSHWGPGAERRTFGLEHWEQPYHWNTRAFKEAEWRRVFCGSMCDVLDPDADDLTRQRLWGLIRATPFLDWLLLSKRPQLYRETFERLGRPDNIWAGASASTQRELDETMQHLQGLDCRVRFLSLEPLIEPVSVASYAGLVEWVIVGGESGPGSRPCDTAWLETLIDQCEALDIPLFVKQLGRRAICHGFELPLLDPKGGNPDEWLPGWQDLRHVPDVGKGRG